MKVVDDVAEDVEAGEIERPERRAPGRPIAGPVIASTSSIVYSPVADLREDLRHSVQADVIADEVRRVLREHDALAEPVIGEVRDGVDDRLLRLRRRNDLEQAQVARRVEEVRAEPVAAEIVAASLSERGDRNARRVRADDRSRPARGVDLLEQRALDVEPLDDGLDDPVASREASQAGVEAGGRDQRPRVGSEERVGLERPRALQSLRRGVGVTSSSSDGTPALAKWAAICAPITPAPSTATERITGPV